MRNALDTLETPGRGLDDLERRLDGVRRGVRGAGDHAVGQPELDHHRAEVGHRRDDLARPLDGHALVLAHLGVLDGEPLEQLAVVRVDDRGVVEVEAQLGGAGADGRLVAEDREVARRRAAAGSTRRAGSGRRSPSGSTTCWRSARARSSSANSNISGVTTSGRSTSSAASRAAPSTCCSNSDSAVSTLRCESAGEASVRVADGARGPERAQLGADDRQPAAEPVDQAGDQRRGQEAAVEDDAGQRREAVGLVRHEQAEQHVGAVAGRDDDRPVGQPVQQVLDRHRADHARRAPRATAAPRRPR